MVQNAREMFADAACDGRMSISDFTQIRELPDLGKFFESLGLGNEEANALFALIDTDGDNVVDCEEFINGCLRLRGTAKAIDLVTLMQDNRRLSQAMTVHVNKVESELKTIRHNLRSDKKKLDDSMLNSSCQAANPNEMLSQVKKFNAQLAELKDQVQTQHTSLSEKVALIEKPGMLKPEGLQRLEVLLLRLGMMDPNFFAMPEGGPTGEANPACEDV
eukprot:gnl/TRDRNA2_/TRDRNA2_161992_c3_seq2.p1 gnl/TRDRNA2_/TRDRNA2_161992_c3~~gnl/TRDRNA2_/TRDRNA2_161992_c3_seq2.p1  ORF type:complete len:218 (-),score=59.23 gnl/TRDRNA2_/TRDRNA2_161992_c3_seq2:119-772(-)